jgi:predicted dehydrogenase
LSLRVGLLGFGEIAQVHLRHLRAAGARVTAAVTRRPTPHDITPFSTLEGMLPHVDAVSVAVPNAGHAAACLAVLRADLPVFVEKPLCISEAELDALEPVLRAARVPVHLGFRLRWNPAVLALRAALARAGETPGREPGARVEAVSCTYRLGIDRLASNKPWTYRFAESGGAFFTLGVHAFDLARWIASARGARLVDLHAATDARTSAADYPLVARLSGRLPGGAVIEAAACLDQDVDFQLEMRINGRVVPLATLAEVPPESPAALDREYGAMMANFVRAAEAGVADADEVEEQIALHRDLLAARAASQATGVQRLPADSA